jgi:hypothetical protein
MFAQFREYKSEKGFSEDFHRVLEFLYHQVLWKGFNHEGEPEEPVEIQIEGRRSELSGPHNNPRLKIAVMAPDGSFLSFCGMWYELEMGKAAVLEAVKRCKELGAERAYVGSSQQFYYRIGFRPCSTKTWWERKE